MRRNNHFFSGFSGFCLLVAICWYGKDFYQEWKADSLPVRNLAMYQIKAQMIFDRAGYR